MSEERQRLTLVCAVLFSLAVALVIAGFVALMWGLFRLIELMLFFL